MRAMVARCPLVSPKSADKAAGQKSDLHTAAALAYSLTISQDRLRQWTAIAMQNQIQYIIDDHTEVVFFSLILADVLHKSRFCGRRSCGQSDVF